MTDSRASLILLSLWFYGDGAGICLAFSAFFGSLRFSSSFISSLSLQGGAYISFYTGITKKGGATFATTGWRFSRGETNYNYMRVFFFGHANMTTLCLFGGGFFFFLLLFALPPYGVCFSLVTWATGPDCRGDDGAQLGDFFFFVFRSIYASSHDANGEIHGPHFFDSIFAM